jgi:hypothetical protein
MSFAWNNDLLGTIGKSAMASKKKTRVFISYSRHDEALVKPLSALLGSATNDAVFLDISSLDPGDLWEEKIIEAVKESSVFVLCWCCECKKSEFIAKEISTALSDRRKRLVPVLLCPMDLPTALASRQWIDLRGRVAHDCTEKHEKKSWVGSPGSGGGGGGWSMRRNYEYRAGYESKESSRASRDIAWSRGSSDGFRHARSEYAHRSPPTPVPSRPLRSGRFGCIGRILVLTAIVALTWWGFHSHREFTSTVLKLLGYSLVGLIMFVLCYRLISRAVHIAIRTWQAKQMKEADDIENQTRSYFEGLGNTQKPT